MSKIILVCPQTLTLKGSNMPGQGETLLYILKEECTLTACDKDTRVFYRTHSGCKPLTYNTRGDAPG